MKCILINLAFIIIQSACVYFWDTYKSLTKDFTLLPPKVVVDS